MCFNKCTNWFGHYKNTIKHFYNVSNVHCAICRMF